MMYAFEWRLYWRDENGDTRDMWSAEPGELWTLQRDHERLKQEGHAHELCLFVERERASAFYPLTVDWVDVEGGELPQRFGDLGLDVPGELAEEFTRYTGGA